MNVSFSYWYNEIADIPVQDEKGVWYDAETGIRFNQNKSHVSKIVTNAERRYGSLKVAELRETAHRLVKSTAYSVKKYKNVYNVSVLEEVLKIAENIDKMKRAELFEFIEMNSKASRILNNQINK